MRKSKAIWPCRLSFLGESVGLFCVGFVVCRRRAVGFGTYAFERLAVSRVCLVMGRKVCACIEKCGDGRWKMYRVWRHYLENFFTKRVKKYGNRFWTPLKTGNGLR